MAQAKTLLLVDEHPLFREGAKAILKHNDRFKVVGEAGNGSDGLRKAKKLQPDVVLISTSLPDTSGIQLSRRILSLYPKTLIMITSTHNRIDFISDSFQAGASGYMAKESAPEKLLKGLDYILKGDYFLDDSANHEVIKHIRKSPTKGVKFVDSAYQTLTPREQEVMGLLAEEFPTKIIAEKLVIRPKTVENYRTNIMKKLGIRNIIELIRYAEKHGLNNLHSYE